MSKVERFCFYCQTKLSYDNYIDLDTNFKFSKRQLNEFWEKKYFPIFCCNCQSQLNKNRISMEDIEKKYKEYEEAKKKYYDNIKVITKKIDTSKFVKMDKFLKKEKIHSKLILQELNNQNVL